MVGGTTPVELQINNSGQTASAAGQELTVAGGAGLSATATIGTPGPALRPDSVHALAAPSDPIGTIGPAQAGITLRCTTTTNRTAGASSVCLLPPVTPGTPLRIVLRLAVSAATPPGPVSIAVNGTVLDAIAVPATGGYLGAALTSAQAGANLPVGATTELTFAATPRPGATAPGPITLPKQLGAGLTVIGAEAPCALVGETVSCTPGLGGTIGSTLTVKTGPPSSSPLVSARLAGDRTLGISSAIAVREDVSPVSLAVDGDLIAGKDGILTVTAQLAPGLLATDGTISIPAAQHDVLLRAGTSGCVLGGGILSCPLHLDRSSSSHQQWTIPAAALPVLTGPTVTFSNAWIGGAAVPVASSASAASRAPGDPISITGPFGGAMVGAETMQCRQATTNRGNCLDDTNSPGLIRLDGTNGHAPLVQQLTVPVGATIISAELTWAATAAGDDFDKATLSVDGNTVVAAGTQVHQDPSLTVQTADLTTSLAGGLLSPGTHDLQIAALNAAATTSPMSPMAGWSLTVLWGYPDDGAHPSVTIDTTNDSTALQSGASTDGNSLAIAPAGSTIRAVGVTAWAADPWAAKSLKAGGQMLACTFPVMQLPLWPSAGPDSEDCLGYGRNTFTGTTGDTPQTAVTTGVDIRTFTGAFAGPITMYNQQAGGILDNMNFSSDTLWIGPVLVIRDPVAVA